MADDKKQAETKPSEINEKQLDDVSGGINPQPLPPGKTQRPPPTES